MSNLDPEPDQGPTGSEPTPADGKPRKHTVRVYAEPGDKEPIHTFYVDDLVIFDDVAITDPAELAKLRRQQ
jgi:hypothetical protein